MPTIQLSLSETEFQHLLHTTKQQTGTKALVTAIAGYNSTKEELKNLNWNYDKLKRDYNKLLERQNNLRNALHDVMKPVD